MKKVSENFEIHNLGDHDERQSKIFSKPKIKKKNRFSNSATYTDLNVTYKEKTV